MMNDETETTQTQPARGTPVDGSAAQTRVTGEELARALTQIEARKEAEAQRLAGTIPLGQAVAELGLKVTPEELLAEVPIFAAETGLACRRTRHGILIPESPAPSSAPRQARNRPAIRHP